MMATKFFGGVLATFGILNLIAFPVLIFLGIWSDGNVVHRYVGTGFLCLLFGLICFGIGMFMIEEG